MLRAQLFFSPMSTLVECVPNFSEGCDKAKVDAIVDAMKVAGVYLLDREMDADHNRCVITLVGEREAIQEAAIRGAGKAAELIDLNVHKGAHPRMGATDVVPFIPIDGVTIEDCVAMARHVGEEIWKRFQIPVYLYEAAAVVPERQNLEYIRRGQFEGIRAEDCDERGAQARFWRGESSSYRGRDGCGRAQVSDRLQRILEHARCRDREEDCEGGAIFEWRHAIREGRGISGARAGAGFDESDGL